MNTKFVSVIATVLMALVVLPVLAAARGTFQTQLAWAPYGNTNANGFNVYVGTNTGVYTTNYYVAGHSTTNIVIPVQPGATYFAALAAVGGTSTNFYESDLSPEITWSTPPALPVPQGFRQAVTVYIR